MGSFGPSLHVLAVVIHLRNHLHRYVIAMVLNWEVFCLVTFLREVLELWRRYHEDDFSVATVSCRICLVEEKAKNPEDLW